MKDENMGGVGQLIVIAVLIIVGVILFQVVAQNTGDITNTVTLTNSTYTAGANGETFYITDYKYISSPVISNASGGEVIAEGNYTITNNVVYEGNEVIAITVDDAEYESMDWNVSGTVQPLTYSSNSGTRGMVTMIPIFFALAIVVAAMWPVLQNRIFD